MKFDFSYLSEALNSVFGAKLYAWDRLYSYGILLGVVCVTFVIRKSVVKFFTHWLGLHKHEEVAPQGVTNFSQPLELAFIGVVAFITLKFLPSLPMEKQLSHFFWTLIVLAICWGVFRAIHMYSGKLEKIYAAFDKGLSKEIAKVVTDILRILTIVIGTFVVLDLWEINIAALMGGVGIASAALALASQDTIKNMFGAMSIILDHSFILGEYVRIDSVEGTVEDIGLRSTLIRQNDQALIRIPNANIVNVPVMNFSRAPYRAVNLELPFEHRSDPEQLKQFIEKVKEFIRQHPLYQEKVKGPPLLVYLDKVSSDGSVVIIRFFIHKIDLESMCLIKEECLYFAKQIAKKLDLGFYRAGSSLAE